MSSGIGDITAVLTLDEYEYANGLKQASEQTEQFAADAEGHGSHIGHSLHRPLHKATHLAMAASFAMSAGEGDKGLVSGLERASMLIPMIGMAFGPMGAAVGIAGGLIVSQILGPLKAAEEESKRFGEAIAAAGERWDKLVNQRGAEAKFDLKLGRIDAGTSPDDIAKQKQDLNDLVTEKQAMLEEAQRKQKALQGATKPSKEELKKGQITDMLPFGLGDIAKNLPLGAAANFVQDQFRGDEPPPVIGGEKAQAALKKTNEQVEDLKREIETAKHQAEALHEKLDDSKVFEEAKRHLDDMAEREKERLETVKKIGDEVATPYEKAKEKLDELTNALNRGDIGQDLFQRATDKLADDLGKQNVARAEPKVDQVNNAVLANTSGGYEAIAASIRSAKGDKADTEVTLLKKNVDVTVKCHEELRDVNKNLKIIEVTL